MSFQAFDAAIAAFQRGLQEETIPKFQRAIALRALRGVVMKTPVDTGRARANWQVGVDEVGEKVLSSFDKSGGDAIARGAQKLATGMRKPGWSQITIYNNVEYIKYLEDGTDRMKAFGMVARTIRELTEMLQ